MPQWHLCLRCGIYHLLGETIGFLRRFLIRVVLEETTIRCRNSQGLRTAIVPSGPLRISYPQSAVVDSSQEWNA